MRELLWWTVGASAAWVFTLLILADAVDAWRWSKGEQDAALIREAWGCVQRQALALLTQTVMVAVAIMAYSQWHTDWILWGLIILPWTITARVILDYIRRHRFFRQKTREKEDGD